MAEPLGTTVETPDITTVVNQQVFIEPLGGPKHPVSYLDAFPETLYNKSLDSNLVALMYTLLGPAGVGTLKQNYLEARLNVEANGLRTVELDSFYAEPFSFARLAFETYTDDTEGLLNNQQWENIQESDSSYKNRAINYLKAVRAGGTVLGVTLAAKSALNRAVEVIENYHALYDGFSDDPLGLEHIGLTKSTEEVILLPRQEHPQSAQQTISIEEGNAIAGTFKLTMPLGPGRKGNEEVQNTSTTPALPFDIDFEELTLALEALPVIGPRNVSVTGGPFPGNLLVISFTNELADKPMPQFLITQNSLANNESQLIEIEVTVDQVGVSADGEEAIIPTEDWYFAQVAIDNIKPVTCIVTPGKAPGTTKRQIPSSTFADSEFIEVLRYVTGKRGLPWPPVSSTTWIEPGVENEAPVAINGQHANYVNFHNIAGAVAYTEEGAEHLEEVENYKDEHIGPYSAAQQAQYPFLATFQSPRKEFKAIDAAVNPPEPLTTKTGPEPLVNYIYPAVYQNLAQIQGAPSETAPFWSSLERLTGSDYLEIDFGTVQAINFLSFEASQKPFKIAVSYDLLDAAPARKFIPVTLVDEREAISTQSTSYEAKNVNQWSLITMNVNTSLSTMIYTRFIRLEFTRPEEGLPFPYSADIRNLRIGRNVAP
jgi:hypothetical protein